jgi:hypothetical protein
VFSVLASCHCDLQIRTSGIGGTFQDLGAGGRNFTVGYQPATGKGYTFAETLGKD